MEIMREIGRAKRLVSQLLQREYEAYGGGEGGRSRNRCRRRRKV